MRRITPPNYTQIPNVVLDHARDITEAELRVVLAICRQTFGWHKEQARLSVTALQEATGLCRPAVIAALKRLEERPFNWIERQPEGRSFSYRIALEIPPADGSLSEPSMVNEVNHQTPPDGSLSEPSMVNEVNQSGACLNSSKETLKEKIPAGSPAGPSPVHLFKVWWGTEFPAYHGGQQYVHLGAKDAASCKRMFSAGVPLDRAKELALAAWQAPKGPKFFWCQKAVTMTLFATRINDIAHELAGIAPAQTAEHNPTQGDWYDDVTNGK